MRKDRLKEIARLQKRVHEIDILIGKLTRKIIRAESRIRHFEEEAITAENKVYFLELGEEEKEEEKEEE